jgi:hypothetical protein
MSYIASAIWGDERLSARRVSVDVAAKLGGADRQVLGAGSAKADA